MTTHYDGAGLVTSVSVTVAESEFNSDDVAALLASSRRAKVRRSPTGYTIAEATDPKNRFRPSGPLKDVALDALLTYQDIYFSKYPEAKSDRTLIWNLEKQ